MGAGGVRLDQPGAGGWVRGGVLLEHGHLFLRAVQCEPAAGAVLDTESGLLRVGSTAGARALLDHERGLLVEPSGGTARAVLPVGCGWLHLGAARATDALQRLE